MQTQEDAADTTIINKGHRVVQTLGLDSRRTQKDTADSTIVNRGHSIVQTQEMDIANEMKRKAQVVLQEHKRRLGAGGDPQ